MSDKAPPDLTVIHSQPIMEMPIESLNDFKHWVLEEGMLPSNALRKMMDKYECPNPDVSILIQLVERTYPDINIAAQGFRFYMTDSGYPNSDPNQFSDEDFDTGIKSLLEHPTKGW